MHVATLRRDILGFLFIPLWLTTSTAVKDMLRNVHRHIQDWCFTWWSYLWKHSRKLLCSTLDGTGEKGKSPWMALEKKGNQAKVLMVRNWTSIWDAIRSIPAASPPHLRGRTRRDSNEKPAFIRDRLTPASKEAWVEHLSLHPHLEQRGMPPVEKKPWNWASLFSLLQMGASSSRITLLSCILKTWDKFDPQSLKNPLYEGFLCFKRRPHLPRETIPAGTTSYQSVNSCQQSQFEHCLV